MWKEIGKVVLLAVVIPVASVVAQQLALHFLKKLQEDDPGLPTVSPT